HLHAAHRSNVGRNMVLRATSWELAGALNRAGIVPLFLKGSLYLVDGTFPDIGARVMSDLDLLVRSEEVGRAIQSLEALGWVANPKEAYLHPHEIPLARRGAVHVVELHTSVGDRPLPAVLPTDEVWA